MNIILNITDHILMLNEPVRNEKGIHLKDKNNKFLFRNLTRLETYEKIYNECSNLLSEKVIDGQLDVNKEHTLFVSTKYGAVTVTIIPRSHFQ